MFSQVNDLLISGVKNSSTVIEVHTEEEIMLKPLF